MAPTPSVVSTSGQSGARSRPTLLGRVAARLARSSRHLILRLSANWPWTPDLHSAFAALDDLPVPAG